MTLIDKAEALLPCPFCGGEAELWNAHDNRPAWIACMGRCAVLISKEHATDAEAIAAWNRRAALPACGVGVPTDPRPANCRFRLKDEGKPYGRSSCSACGKSVFTGLGNSCSNAPTDGEAK